MQAETIIRLHKSIAGVTHICPNKAVTPSVVVPCVLFIADTIYHNDVKKLLNFVVTLNPFSDLIFFKEFLNCMRL